MTLKTDTPTPLTMSSSPATDAGSEIITNTTGVESATTFANPMVGNNDVSKLKRKVIIYGSGGSFYWGCFSFCTMNLSTGLPFLSFIARAQDPSLSTLHWNRLQFRSSKMTYARPLASAKSNGCRRLAVLKSFIISTQHPRSFSPVVSCNAMPHENDPIPPPAPCRDLASP